MDEVPAPSHSMPLPRLLLVTDRHAMQPSFDAALESALRGGARLIQLREKELPSHKLLQLALRAQRLCEGFSAELLINSHVDIARAAHTAGVHFPENELPSDEARRTLGEHALCGVSVHSLEAARRAIEAGADYLVFGSVFSTASHPDAPPAGLKALREVVESAARTGTPVFAVGGINTHNAALCRQAGAHGAAVISAVWDAPDVEAAVRALLAAVA